MILKETDTINPLCSLDLVKSLKNFLHIAKICKEIKKILHITKIKMTTPKKIIMNSLEIADKEIVRLRKEIKNLKQEIKDIKYLLE